MMFSFLAWFIHRATEFTRNAPMTVLHKKYSEPVLRLIIDWDDEKKIFEKIVNVSKDVKRLKELITSTFEAHYEA